MENSWWNLVSGKGESVWRPGGEEERGMLGEQEEAGGAEAGVDSGWRERLVRLTGPSGSRKESGFGP